MLVFHLRLSKFNIKSLITTSICSQDCPYWSLFVHANARFIIKVLCHHSHVVCIVIISEIIIVSLLVLRTICICKIVLRLVLMLLLLWLVLIEVSTDPWLISKIISEVRIVVLERLNRNRWIIEWSRSMEYILFNCGYGTTLHRCLTCLYGRALYFVCTFNIKSWVGIIDFDILAGLLFLNNCCKLELLLRCI